MTTGVDSSVLFDLLIDDPVSAESAQRELGAAASAGPTLICPVVYAELAAHFSRPEDLDQFLRDLTIEHDSFRPEALWEAARTWKTYLARRGQDVQCGRCSHRFPLPCPKCGAPIAWRQHTMPDFLIAAHALVQAYALLTRDRGFYRTYFPQLRLLPASP
jgi:predicted nucleic acid-binding protein